MPSKLKQILLNPSMETAYPKISDARVSRPSSSLVSCPIGVPLPLWSSLQQKYNCSQMRAISSICLQHNQNSSLDAHFPFLLLQGPPGTGELIILSGSLR